MLLFVFLALGAVASAKTVVKSPISPPKLIYPPADGEVCLDPNEAVDPCPSPCFTDGCEDFFRTSSTCNTFVEVECVAKCRCKPDYARDCNNKCIPGNQCPGNPCTDPEVFDSCPPPCFSDSCYQFRNPITTCNTLVKHECAGQCRCKDGYARLNETCIPGDQCPPSSEYQF